MTRRRAAPAPGMAGFTVLEMLVALAILTMVMGTGSMLLRRPSPGVQIEASARNLCAALRLTRSRALATNAETTLTIDLATKSFVSPVISETAFPREAEVQFTVADRMRTSRTAGGFLFFPGGGSTGGEVTIQAPGKRIVINVNWLTGETRCEVS